MKNYLSLIFQEGDVKTDSLQKCFSILLGALVLSVAFKVWAQQPQEMIESQQTMQLETKVSKTIQELHWDLSRFIEMPDPKEAAKELRKHVEQYGISLDSSPPSIELDTEREKLQSFGMKEKQNLIHLFSGDEFTPIPGVELSLAERITHLFTESRGQEKIVCILQFQGKMTMGDIIELFDSNVKIYENIGRRTYLVKLPASTISLISSNSYVRWIGEYKPEYKYTTTLSNSGKPGAFIYAMGGDRPEYRAELQRLGVIIKHYDTTLQLYEVILDISKFREIAEELWWVKGISKIPEIVLLQVDENFEPDDSRELVNAFKTSFTGNGVPVGVYDSGIWHGNTFDFPNGSYHDYENHGDINGHGTHVCGIIAARGGRDIEGLHDAKGVAPGAFLYVISGINEIGGYTYTEAFQYFFANDVLISNHSYKLHDNDYAYDSDTENIDGWADNNYMVIFAAGNDSDPRTITNPATGKNVITVGGITYVEDDYRTPDIGDRSVSSSQGPTADDSRLKPDLVAPGGQSYLCYYGVVSTNNSSNSGACTWPTSSWYTRKTGTSMAAPHVTGVCAKIQEWKPDISSELLKALLINTTIPIKENSSNALAGYANTQVGYGLVNGHSVTNYYSGEYKRLLFGQGVVTEDELEDDWYISVSSEAKKLIVTLAYNDLKGEESDIDVLKNNLDLHLISPSGSHYWAYLSKAAGVTDESPLEKVVITDPESGTWTVKVSFFDGPYFNDPLLRAVEIYGIVAHEILKTPSLNLTVPAAQTTIEVWPGEYFSLNPTVTNDGGYIATGVTLMIGGGGFYGFKEDMNETWYVGNLMYRGASASHQFIIQAPTTPGTYTLRAYANGINLEFRDDPAYPRRKDITVIVRDIITATVNTTDDLDDGTCNDTHCSLREAINLTNIDPEINQIHFNIPDPGPHTIQFLSPLPTVTDPVIIDATTQDVNADGPMIKLSSPWTTVIHGLVITAGNSIVRGFEIQAAGDGIRLLGNGNNVIEKNVIHCWYDGIRIENSSNNIIGGRFGETGNTIYYNAEGIYITGSGSSGNKIVGNIVGTDGNIFPTGNNHNGIYIVNAGGNTIGGKEMNEMNLISGNGENGIYISGSNSSGNKITSNSIYSNSGLGIDLGGDGATPNDFGDGDTGPNDLQNFPLITSVTSDIFSSTINGTIFSNPNTSLSLQFFSNSLCDPSLYGEGKRLLGDISLTTNRNGYASFSKLISPKLPISSRITATATGLSGTSEFSKCRSTRIQLRTATIVALPLEGTYLSQSMPYSLASNSFSSLWTGSDVEMILTTPSGRIIDRSTNATDVVHENGPNYEVYTVTNPEAGQWTIELYGADVPPEGEEVTVSVAGLPVNPTLVTGIDIKPEGNPNSINCLNANGRIPVAILSTAEFDALSVDHTTVRFGRTGSEAAEFHTKNGQPKRHEEDVDGDGDVDLIFHFRFGDTDIECGDEQAFLTGETFDGLEIIGIDEIRTVGEMPKESTIAGIPDEFSLKNAYPNPFNPMTIIQYDLPKASEVRLEVFNVLGQLVSILVNEQKEPGYHNAVFHADGIASGIYIYRLMADDFVEIKKMVLMK